MRRYASNSNSGETPLITLRFKKNNKYRRFISSPRVRHVLVFLHGGKNIYCERVLASSFTLTLIYGYTLFLRQIPGQLSSKSPLALLPPSQQINADGLNQMDEKAFTRRVASHSVRIISSFRIRLAGFLAEIKATEKRIVSSALNIFGFGGAVRGLGAGVSEVGRVA